MDKPWFGRLYAHVERVEAKASLGKEYLYLNTQGRQGLPEHVRVARPLSKSEQPIRAGDTIIIRARLMPPAPPEVPGAYDFSERAYFQGLGATSSIIGAVRLIDRSPRWGESQILQQPLSQLVQSRISGDAGAIAATLASGDRGGISAEADEWMRSSGMAHLLSISGLHVTALVGTVYLIVARILALFPFIALRANIPLVAASAGAIGAVFYTWLTGAEVPTIRSCIAALLILAALVIGREPLSMRVLAIGATVVLILWPESIMGPSFQLSFAAVAAIIALHDMPVMRRLREQAVRGGWVHRLGNGVLSLFLTGLLVELTLSPIALYHFQHTGLYGALANMIAIPLTTFLIMPLLALCLAFDWTGMAQPLWAVTGGLLDALLYVAEAAATAPGAKLMAPTFPPWTFGLFAFGLCVLYLMSSKGRWIGLVPVVIGLTTMLMTPAPDILIDSSGRHMAIRDDFGRAYFLHSGKGEFVRDMMQEQMGQGDVFAAIESHPGAQCNAHICLIRMRSGHSEAQAMAGQQPHALQRKAGDGSQHALTIASAGTADRMKADLAGAVTASNYAELPQEKAPSDSLRGSVEPRLTEDRQSKANGSTVTILVTRSNQYLDYPSLIAACAAADIAISDRPLPKDCKPKWLKADLFALRRTGGLAIYLTNRKVVSVAEAQSHLPWSIYNPANRKPALTPH